MMNKQEAAHWRQLLRDINQYVSMLSANLFLKTKIKKIKGGNPHKPGHCLDILAKSFDGKG